MADTMDIPREEVLLGRCCECGIGLDPRTHPTMTCVNCLQARVLIAASRGDRRLHAIDATRLQERRSWVVSGPNLGPFGPNRRDGVDAAT